ncbi:hypothetical protein HZH66_012946 [Vespula vulgaris]|uniref:Sema domain-containing protein n=1 Tax=Vespula vulgaris TaxID=7454 RepID=A0A834JDG5_VESVU|nr:hypothetical protein HZH66_012946 [Vespula vulgaris]
MRTKYGGGGDEKRKEKKRKEKLTRNKLNYLLQRFQWSSSGAHRELCNLKGRSDDECQNYLRVFGRQGPNKFLVCGTNAYKPLCRQFTIKVSPC